MALSDIVDVQISVQTQTVSRVGFGTPMLMSSEAASVLAETAKVYTDTAGMISDGFKASGRAVQKMQKLLGQNPKPARFVIGKRSNLPQVALDLIPAAQNSRVYRVIVRSEGDGVNDAEKATGFQFTSDVTATPAEITAGLTAAMNQPAWAPTTAYAVGDYVRNGTNPDDRVYRCVTAGTSDGSGGPSGTGASITDGTVVWTHEGRVQNILASDTGTTVTVQGADGPGGSATPGVLVWASIQDRSLLTMQDLTADPGVVADLNSIRTALDGNDDWYFAAIDTNGDAEILALAAAIEPLEKLFGATTSNQDVADNVASNLAETLAGLSYRKTILSWHEDAYLDISWGWSGAQLPKDPGSTTWKFKTVVGYSPSTLAPDEVLNLQANNVNFYQTVAGINIMCDGKVVGGEWIDVTRFIAYLTQRMKENIFLQLATLEKVPFTNTGIAVVENEVRGTLKVDGVDVGGLAPDTEDTPIIVSTPLASEVPQNEKANRILPDTTFSAVLAGAIHTVEVRGTVTV